MSSKQQQHLLINDIIAEEVRKASLFAKVFGSPDGEDVLKALEEEFYNRTSIVPGDPYATHAMEGAREVILFIHQQMKLGDNNE